VRHFLIFLFSMVIWLVISSTTMESILFGTVISLFLSFILKNSPSPKSLIYFLYSYLRSIPKSILEAFELSFKIKKNFIRRIVDIPTSAEPKEINLAIDMLTITLTPKTIAFDFSENIIFIHEVFPKND